MTAAAIASDGRRAQPARRPALRVETIRRVILWIFIASGASAVIEPSPFEFMFAIAAIAYAGAGGLRFDRSFGPMIVCLSIYEAGGLIALPPFVEERESVTFVIVSIYIAVLTIFFAALVAADPLKRMRTIRSGYVVGGLFAAALGILGYFDVAGLGPLFTLYDNARATGPFKDPNVFGPFLVPPVVWLAQDLLLKRGGWLWSSAAIGVLSLAVLLSFSRGAWGVYVGSLAIMGALTAATTTSARIRGRVVLVGIAGALFLALALAVALSIPAINDVFIERASLSQDYDLGEMGRFGAQLRSIPMLLERPFGFGPLRYHTMFPAAEDSHEVYINAFASYGWLGGLAFFAFTGLTLYVGWRLVFQRSRYQNEAIAVWSCLFPQMLQGLQIDSDHWRHLFLLFGALYGLAAAARIEEARAGPDLQRRAIV
jgi:hypothetical protein